MFLKCHENKKGCHKMPKNDEKNLNQKSKIFFCLDSKSSVILLIKSNEKLQKEK